MSALLLWGLLPFIETAADGGGGTASWLAPTVISSAIAGGVAMVVHLSAQKARQSESREDIRSEAFDQAKAYYVDVIDRQDHEIGLLRVQVAEALSRATDAETAADTCRSAVRRLNSEIRQRDRLIEELRAG